MLDLEAKPSANSSGEYRDNGKENGRYYELEGLPKMRIPSVSLEGFRFKGCPLGLLETREANLGLSF